MPDPLPIADARAIVLDPGVAIRAPAVIFAAWARLVEARGGNIARPDMLRPAHLIRAASPADPVCAQGGFGRRYDGDAA